MVKIITLIFWLLSVLCIGCSANTPLPEPFYTSDLTVVNGYSFQREDGYWRSNGYDAISLYGTGTLLTPNVSSLGGYRLDAIAEYLYFTAFVGNDWNSVDNAQVAIYFEVNEDNTGGAATDVTRFQLECWHKVEGELGCTVWSLEGSTTVGTSQQHELFTQIITISNIRAGEVVSFRINLNTILGDITNVIVNYVEFKYPTLYPSEER